MLGKRKVRAVALAAVFLTAAVLACVPTEREDGVNVAITNPPDGAAVRIGEVVEVGSVTTAEAGVARVELSVDGVVVRRDSPPSGSPTTFSIAQPWVPEAEGRATVGVVAFDTAGIPSEMATVTLQVVAASGEGPTQSPEPPSPEETPTPQQTPTPEPEVETEAGCTLNASYVADVTVPDGTVFAPGTGFGKTWRIRNSGTCDWTAGFQFVFVGGDQMGGEAAVAVPPTVAGSTVDLSVNLTAPSAPGTYKGNWRMQSDEGLAFGNTVYVQIVVPAPATDTPEITDTPEPTHTPEPTSTPEPTDTPTPWIPALKTLPPVIKSLKPPSPSFQVWGKTFHNCGADPFMVMLIKNTGSLDLEWVQMSFTDLTTLATGKRSYDEPFMINPNHCPPKKETLGPGAQAYIAGNINFITSGGPGRVTVRGCTQNGGGGLCAEQTLDFTAPQ